MGVFLGILAVGLVHAWRRGALHWAGQRHGRYGVEDRSA